MNNPQNMRGTKVAPPAGPGSFIGKAWRKLIVDTVNCFWNPTIKIKTLAPDGTQSIMTDTPIEMGPMGWVATIDLTSIVGTAATSTVPFSGAGAPSSSTLSSSFSYVAGATPSLYVDTTNKLLYYCTTAGTNSTSVWAAIVGSGGCTQFKIISDGGDVWNCKTWDGTTLGSSTVYVYKPFKLRAGGGGPSSETIRGVTYDYTYVAVTVGSVTGYYKREVRVSGVLTETDYLIPDPLADDVIYATPLVNGGSITWLDINADGRAYAQ